MKHKYLQRIAGAALRILLIVSALVYPGMMAMLSAAGWRYHAAQGNYPGIFNAYAFWMTLGGVLLLSGTVLCLMGARKRLWLCNPAAVVCAGCGLWGCLWALQKFCLYADQNFSGVDGTMQPVSELYRDRISPVILPFLCICLLSAWQFFRYEARVYRKQQRIAAQEKENAPAPKILADAENEEYRDV